MEQEKRRKKFTRQERSWIMYDWANSAYVTIMVTAIMPIYFADIAGNAGQAGDYWWGIGSSLSMAVMALLAPIIGTMADFKGYKKKLFCLFLALGLGFSLFSVISTNWVVLLIGYSVSHVGFLGSCLIYDSFLTDVTNRENMDHVSSFGYASGYIGGSTIPFLASILLVSLGDRFGIDAVLAVKLSVLIMVFWWGIFSLPFIKNVKQKHSIEKPERHFIKHTFLHIGRTLKNIARNKKLLFFLLAYFFYIDGVGTVISMSTSYGTTLGLDATGMILALMVTQLIAFPCAILYSNFSQRIGSYRMILGAVLVYSFICILGFVMGFGLEKGFLTIRHSLLLFWLLAVLVGTVQGGIQAISRSYFGKIVPPEQSGEYFGFFDIFGKFASVMGPGLYAFTKNVTGSSALSILSILLLFSAALFLLLAGKKHLC